MVLLNINLSKLPLVERWLAITIKWINHYNNYKPTVRITQEVFVALLQWTALIHG